MNAIIYARDGSKISFQEALQTIASTTSVNEIPDSFHIFGDFNDVPGGTIRAVENINFELTGLHDALTLFVSDSLKGIETVQELRRLLTAFASHVRPNQMSAKIAAHFRLRLSQWAQSHLMDIRDFQHYLGTHE